MTTDRDYESNLASLCDYINTYAREVGSYQAPMYTLPSMKAAIDGIVFGLRADRNKAESKRDAVLEILDEVSGDLTLICGRSMSEEGAEAMIEDVTDALAKIRKARL